ncbi:MULTISPECIES: NAD(P)/FAD-dependent oxidoreductase [unclassified Methanoculleus]|uniref:dihydrolipoyl dehydrogenase family protein n=1 Tax=unclassified Methanoculleus TaxID=2619537 RepID=UPI0025E6A309|nr:MULTISPECIES: NAD(P)/FAD-dependent oxidoreductase [unclassified Methanoculleus]MCK9319030.1 NAD(P)/FAD-dependent oxidoreductase [Methanoculleus sp.]MDD2254283.1 NAD(P)/FAD-dependent oxidoreductase [Methanoculleus sp.]MDD2786793.1 NAD(P)/FAD-dependent oxidoreductase [Methanoculleus sp.]MDD3217148.1 NAD(P)/FAD-dependent oxidoreductase [Methanoculleus sp.]MDD4314413.1 NAD(P)/FAD-dependent oxidoreductase [Methanoculleus sp.]
MIVVIGGGPAGRLGAMHLAQTGAEVRLIERRKIGGQCLHERCMTVCALNDTARLVEYARTQKDLGILDSVPTVSYPAIRKRVCEVQEKLSSVLDAETRRAGVEVIYGAVGRLEGNRVFIDDEEVRADAVLAATGSRAAIPEIPGTNLSGVYTYQTLPEMPDLPRRMVIVGGGVVAAEFAHIFHAFGSEVEIVTRHGLLRDLDPKMRSAALRDLSGVGVREETGLASIEGAGRVRSVLLSGGEELAADAVLLATGLVPRSESLQGLRKGPDGAVIVDRQMRTSLPNVYAAGDVIGPPYLTPAARREGVVAAENILGHPTIMDYMGIPHAMSLRYDYASATAGPEGGFTLSAPAPAGPGSFWDVTGGFAGLAQVRVDPETGRLIGAAAAVPGASNLLSYIGYLMKQGVTVDEFDDIVEVHPSTDGVYWLARYAADVLRQRKK